MSVVLLRDKYNFIIAQKLEEEVISYVKYPGVTEPVKMVQTHKKFDKFYGRLGDALIGLAKHDKIKIDKSKIDKELFNITPAMDLDKYSSLIDVESDQILKNLR